MRAACARRHEFGEPVRLPRDASARRQAIDAGVVVIEPAHRRRVDAAERALRSASTRAGNSRDASSSVVKTAQRFDRERGVIAIEFACDESSIRSWREWDAMNEEQDHSTTKSR
ncbi:MAG: hypothetical protein KIT14_22720 [bacterium]|nr:hypothetical protein [bacterium]